jgi:hypothetical protein
MSLVTSVSSSFLIFMELHLGPVLAILMKPQSSERQFMENIGTSATETFRGIFSGNIESGLL